MSLRLKSMLVVAALCLASSAEADTVAWNGNASTTNWFDAGNWDTTTVPTNASATTIGFSESTYNVAINAHTDAVASSLILGVSAGLGTLSLTNGSVLDVSGLTQIAAVATHSRGTLTIDDSIFRTDSLQVGAANSQGILMIQNGGSMETVTTTLVFGSSASGNLTVTGTGSSWTNTGDLIVANGSNSKAYVTISNGATVQTVNTTFGNTNLARASATLTDAGSSWTNTGNLVLGSNAGSGSITVQNGASLQTNNTMFADTSGTQGVLLVTGTGSRWDNTGSLTVGNNSFGAMGAFAGASIHTVDTSVAVNSGGSGNIIVSGTGALWTNSGNVLLGGAGSATMQVTDGASAVISGVLTIARDVDSSATLLIGSQTKTPSAPGTLTASSIVFGSGDGTILFNHTSTNYVFSSSISGNGVIEADEGTTYLTGNLTGFTGTIISSANEDGGGGSLIIASTGTQTISSVIDGSYDISFAGGKTILTSDSSGYQGIINVTGTGILAVNGSLGGTVDVASGGRLQGSGTVETVDVGSSGTVAPGNSIGTLNVSGNITFASGSVFEVEANTTSSDKIVVTGVATITGGTVNLIPYQGAILTAGTTYTILTAAGGVTGTFDGVTSSSAFLTAALSYDANDVYATVTRSNASFSSVAVNQNQTQTALALESLAGTNALSQAILPLSATQAQAAYQALDGELHANIKGSILDQQSAYERILSGRMAQAEDGLTTGAAPSVTKGKKGFEPAVWLQAYGEWGSRDGDGNAQSFGAQTKGMMTGVDWLLGDAWRMGVAFGYGHGDYQQDRSSAQTGTDDAYSVSVYGGKKMGDLALRMGGTYAFHQVDTKRNVSFPSYAAFLKAGYNAHSANAFWEVAYDAVKLEDTKIQPFASAAVNLVAVERFAETGGAAALRGKGSLDGLGSTTLGVRVRQTLPVEGVKSAKAALTGIAAWKHAVGDVNPKNAMSFASSERFKVNGAPLAQNAAILGAGLDYIVRDQTTLGVSYQGQIAPEALGQSVRGNLSYRF